MPHLLLRTRKKACRLLLRNGNQILSTNRYLFLHA
jgi:hypothetical protein